MKNKFIYLAILAAGFASCEPEFDNPVSTDDYSAGEADFSSYVAVGNSLTAGYMDGTVYKSGQENSFPNLLAKQFSVVGGGAFTQPSYEDDVNNLGGIAGFSSTRLIINTEPKTDGSGNILLDCNGNPILKGLQPIAGTSTVTLAPQATAYNNMGVPGAKSFHLLLPGYGSLNPYYARHATSSTSTVLGDAMMKNPTFFTNWIGANDVLAYATSGGIGVNQTGNSNIATYGMNDITDPQTFAFHYNLIINGGTHPSFGPVTGLTANGAKGVVATIPSVTSIPFFTTVPYNPLTACSLGGNNQAIGEATINALNAQLYGPLKQALTAFNAGSRIDLLVTTGGNPLLIKDETLPDLSAQLTAAFTPTLGASTAAFYGSVFGQARQATASDLVLLTTSSVIGTAPAGVPAPLDKYGITYPLQDQHILIPSEQTAIATATAAYNNAIVSVAASKDLAVADMNTILNKLVSGLRADNGTLYTANYFNSGTTEFKVLFSLDGVHPNARGYSVISNEIIKVINSHYKANLPLLNPNDYPGIHILASNN
ncbi:MAG: G-D-S-L family lipolytic protein [Flavobacterium sp.]|uniref:G-D-S-L family lipolytic protein n=1 Tax=unclassified Flavobacterium TaxID=196869 RepID=UPI000C5C50F4|nr:MULTISPECIES: G-D-S-L family lipolytic protein [unclassified Flavobacterium]MBF03042.1 G-D-S-L family lipolytic protein [Flavobacterium sp.]MCO6162204.1 G-D-S-L family lipolytic protein [Flavobacterium sp. NRK F7]